MRGPDAQIKMTTVKKLNVVVFSGGRGAASILEALVGHPQVTVTALVNAYDDGLSTGRLRAYVPGMLGPSDIRKNIGTLMPSDDRCDRALKKFLDFRFSDGTPRIAALASLLPLTSSSGEISDQKLAETYPHLSISQSRDIACFLAAFLSYEAEACAKGSPFEFGDCSLGNLVFTGCYLICDQDFNDTIVRFSEFCRPRGTILNVTDGTNLVLVAIKADGTYVPNETLIVSPQSSSPISEIFLFERYLTATEESVLRQKSPEERLAFLRSLACYPRANQAALDAVAAADLLIYGPGTQHSSLFPSYHTSALAETIAANTSAEKVFVGNIVHDHDIANATVQGLIELFVANMNRATTAQLKPGQLITKLFIQEPDSSSRNRTETGTYVPFDIRSLALEKVNVRARDWESGAGRHSGGQIVDEILAIAKNLLSTKIHPLRHMISIVIPLLDEAATVGRVLAKLEKLDFAERNISKEIIVVDGGSSDGSMEIACRSASVRVYSLEGERGRGAAFRLGVQKARGNLIVLFPADDEYNCEDILSVATPIVENKFNAVFGSRAVKCVNLGERIRSIYGNKYFAYLTSKYGGMSLSILSLVLYDRYITDPLSTLKAYDKRLLDSLDLKSRGVDLECEILGKIVGRQEYILEVPVQYRPRTKEQGKKMTLGSGLRALAALVYYRFSAVGTRSIAGATPSQRNDPVTHEIVKSKVES